MFQTKHFEVFEQTEVDVTLHQIRRYIQPVLRKYGLKIHQQVIEKTVFHQIPIHVAKHIRRKVTLPFNTWVAIGGDGRGYKKFCHLQLGINRQYVFLVVALIDHPPYETEIMQAWMKKSDIIQGLPEDFVFIGDHTDYPWLPMSEMSLQAINRRSQVDVKQDSMIGRIIEKPMMETMDEVDFDYWIESTTAYLTPLFAAGRAIDLHQRSKR